MRKLKFPALIERDEDGWYIGIVPDLRGCHAAARSRPELEKKLKEVVRLCVEVEKGELRTL